MLLKRYIDSATYEHRRDDIEAYFKRLEELACKANISETFLFPQQNVEDDTHLTRLLLPAGNRSYFAQPAVQISVNACAYFGCVYVLVYICVCMCVLKCSGACEFLCLFARLLIYLCA